MQDPNKITRFGLMRHAQTEWNREKKIQGLCDSPLTADGERQASAWGRLLAQYSWDRILTSDSDRALTTAERINVFLNLPIEFDSRLREQDWGRWAGKTVAQVKAAQPLELAEQVNAGWEFRPPGGEDRKSVLARGQRALQEAFGRWPGENILVVTHEGVIKSLVYHLSGRKFLPTEAPLLESYQLHRLVHDIDGLHLEAANALALNTT
ncbi:MAG: histidine phosphatase family protein [Desulfobacterales bacterium]|jgi:probable phosphoglycerate mutase